MPNFRFVRITAKSLACMIGVHYRSGGRTCMAYNHEWYACM